MDEAKFGSVQGLPSKPPELLLGRWVKFVGTGFEAGAVDKIAQNWMADMRQMHTNLMRPAGLQRETQHGRGRFAARIGKDFRHFVMRDGVSATVASCHGDLLSIGGAANEIGVDRTTLPFENTPNERHVGSLQAPIATVALKLLLQRLVRGVSFGDDQKPRGVLVEAMNDARPTHAADSRQAMAAVGDERVHQRARSMAGGRMHNNSGRFIDDDDRIVFEHDFQRHRLRLCRIIGSRWNGYAISLARLDGTASICCGCAAVAHVPQPDQGLQSGAAEGSDAGSQNPVEPLAGFLGSDRYVDCVAVGDHQVPIFDVIGQGKA